eukprot:SM000025S08444  [mRNA]  locus=s25:792409:792930:+ [translate_table: standard]
MPAPGAATCNAAAAPASSSCCTNTTSGFATAFDDATCQSFCVCVNGVDAMRVTCPSGTIFDSTRLLCAPLDSVTNPCPRLVVAAGVHHTPAFPPVKPPPPPPPHHYHHHHQ